MGASEFGFWSECDGKPLDRFNQESHRVHLTEKPHQQLQRTECRREKSESGEERPRAPEVTAEALTRVAASRSRREMVNTGHVFRREAVPRGEQELGKEGGMDRGDL